ncbi:hypothetical protein [Candidatus Enterococcus ikei]|nr:hypothetical protein [Enterococcus sp. DIV0869a]
MIKIKSIYQSYENKNVLADCSLEVYQVEIYGGFEKIGGIVE